MSRTHTANRIVTIRPHRARPPVPTGAIAAVLLFTAAAPAWTQVPPLGEATNAPARLPVVTVVAQKEPAESQSLPVSVTPVPRQVLQDDDITVVKEAEAYAPNTFLNEFSARKLSNPYFRGVGASPNNPGVTTYLDGVPQLNANSSSIELIDVDQIEFVRGPQGALFGRNTVGGLINITSRRPSLTAWRADAQGEFGNYNFGAARLSLSGPLVRDKAGLSLAGGYSGRDGYSVNDFTGHRVDSRDGFFGKGQLLWAPTERWDVRLLLSGERDRDGDYALGDLNSIRARPHHVAYDFQGGYTRRDVLAPTLIARRTGAKVDFVSITGGVWWKTHDLTDLDYTPAPAGTRDNREKDFQFTQEFRLASAPDAPVRLSDPLKLKWQAGASVFTQNYQQDAVNNYAFGTLYQPGSFGGGFPTTYSPPNSQYSPQSKLDDVGVGVYGQATVTAWEKLDLTAGLRGDYEDKSAHLNTFFTTPDPNLGLAGLPRSLNPRGDFSEVSPQFSVAYHLTPRQTAYAAVGRGYKAGGFNPMSPPGSEAYGQENSWSYEIGAKTSWFDDRLTANLAGFYIHWRNLQLNQPLGPQGGYYIANAGSADSKGVELELTARPAAGWEIFGAAGYADARFLSGASAIHTDAVGNNTTVNVGGNHLIYAPDFTVSGGMQYSLPIGKAGTVYVRGEAAAYGRYFYNPANTQSQGSYSLASFRAGLRAKHWFAEGWVRNAFDTAYVPIALEFPNGQSGFIGESGAPVTFGFRAGLTF